MSTEEPEPGEQTASTTRNMAEQAQEKARDLAGQSQEQAQQAAGQAKNRLREQLDERSSQAADRIHQQAADLRAVSESLREQDKGGPASAADKLAEYAEKVGSYLRDRDSDALLSDAEDLGRRQPWAVAAGGLVLGFAASRFLKASSSRRYSTRYDGQASTSRAAGGRSLPPGSAGPAAPGRYAGAATSSVPPPPRASGV